MRVVFPVVSLTLFFLVSASMALAQTGIERFVGDYLGSAEVETYDGSIAKRDMSVSISETRAGFTVEWSSTTYRDNKTKQKSYKVDFVPSPREGIFAAAMSRNVFGHSVQLDPMKGEPYVWARIEGDTLTMFSLYVRDDGGYEMQQFDRTLADGGLQLDFVWLENGENQRSISTFLARQ